MQAQQVMEIETIVKDTHKTMDFCSSSFDGVAVSFTSSYKWSSKKDIAFFEQFLKNKPLADLGCGNNPSVVDMVVFALECGASEYLGIDIENVSNVYNPEWIIKWATKEVGSQKTIPPITLYREDVLLWLSKQSGESHNLVFNGLTSQILNPNREEQQAYLSCLVSEIERVVPLGGIVFGRSSDFLELLDKSPHFKLREDEILQGIKMTFGNTKFNVLEILVFEKVK